MVFGCYDGDARRTLDLVPVIILYALEEGI